MKVDPTVLFLYAETPIHAGMSGGSGYVDNQIQRDFTTRLPIIHSSGIKGVIRDRLPDADALLGTPKDAGKVLFNDARLLLLPVPSLAGVFAWVTCPLAISRLERDMGLFGLTPPVELGAASQAISGLADSRAMVASEDSPIVVAKTPVRVVLDDFCFEATAHDAVKNLAKWLAEHTFPATSDAAALAALARWARRMWDDSTKTSALVVVGDEAFRDLSEFCMTIVERNKVEEGKDTVPWTEEHLPAESLTYCVMTSLGSGNAPAVEKVRQHIEKQRVLQVGGTASLGRGMLSVRAYPAPIPPTGKAGSNA